MMKENLAKGVGVVVCLFVHAWCLAQARPMRVLMNINLKVDTAKVRVYEQHEPEESEHVQTVTFKMNYGDSKVINPEAAQVFEEGGCNIISVDVVHTDYQHQDVQDILNKKRVAELYFLAPDIFRQKMAKWRYVEQLGYATEAGARKLFHGIVVKYIKVPQYKPRSRESMFGDLKNTELSDTSLYELFEKHIKFEEELICADLTGSMGPYYFQVFKWLYMKGSDKTLNFSFFNDGDDKPNYLKKRGKVGGIYMCRTNSIDTLTHYAFACISGGNGGDSPENNIESILKGVEQYPDAKEIIMIADNWADMRDYALLRNVKKPVKVIVCGTNLMGVKSSINPQYLDLARRTGGSIHTIEEDLEDLAKMKEGEKISISGAQYIIRGGKFHRL